MKNVNEIMSLMEVVMHNTQHGKMVRYEQVKEVVSELITGQTLHEPLMLINGNVMPRAWQLIERAADQHKPFIKKCLETIIEKANEGRFSCGFECDASEFIALQTRLIPMGYAIENGGLTSLNGNIVANVFWMRNNDTHSLHPRSI